MNSKKDLIAIMSAIIMTSVLNRETSFSDVDYDKMNGYCVKKAKALLEEVQKNI